MLVAQTAVALTDEGYRVIEAATGEEALERLVGAEPDIDVMLLDLMLPGIGGLQVCRSIRDRSNLPVIIVTARTDTAEVIAGLEAGADDYVTKPLDAGELAARIRALLRRVRIDEGTGGGTAAMLVTGELRIYPAQGRVLRAGREIQLTKTEFRLLCELAAAHGPVVTREELLERVWEYGYFGDTRLLDVHIRRLRRKIEPDPAKPSHIITMRGMGYRVQS